MLGAEHAALVEQAMLDGRKTVVISQQNGSRLYIANTGPAYPLRGILAGAGAGHIYFTEYGGDFQISAPTGAVSLGDIAL